MAKPESGPPGQQKLHEVERTNPEGTRETIVITQQEWRTGSYKGDGWVRIDGEEEGEETPPATPGTLPA